jgi:hypothetical protein
MPDIGDICRAQDLGMVGGRKYIWAECPDCNLQRWAITGTLGKGTRRPCQDCIRAKSKRSFKIGRAHTMSGPVGRGPSRMPSSDQV